MRGTTTIQEGWQRADRGQMRLIRAWEEEALKRRIASGLFLIFLLVLAYLYIVAIIYHDYPQGSVLWKAALLLALLLAVVFFMWGGIVCEDVKEFWKGRFYVRTVVCIGHTEINTRYSQGCYLDVVDGNGQMFEQIKVGYGVLKAVRHQDAVMAVTRDPDKPEPMYLYPLRLPEKQSLGELIKGR